MPATRSSRTVNPRPASMDLTAPHLLTPTLRYVTARTFKAHHAAVMRGFQEPERDELVAWDKKLVEYDRTFGFTVGSRWVATCAAFSQSMTIPGGGAVPVAAVTNVTVSSPFRRQGLLTAMMRHQLDDAASRGDVLATLWASEAGIYGRFGYAPAASRAMLSGHLRRLAFLPNIPLSGSVDEVTGDQFRAVAAALHSAARSRRPGWFARNEKWWQQATFDLEFARQGASELRYLLHYNDIGDVDGYASYRFHEGYTDANPPGRYELQRFTVTTRPGTPAFGGTY